MSDEEFLEFELEIVRLYRSDAEAQESVAVALTVANLIPATDSITRARLDELFAMLQHVHDPFVTGSSQHDPFVTGSAQEAQSPAEVRLSVKRTETG